MKQHDEPPQNGMSGAKVAQSKVAEAPVSRFSSAYWEPRVFKKAYEQDGKRVEIPVLIARVQHGGRREEVRLGTNNREEAGRKAAKFFKTLKASGWDAALATINPDAKPTKTTGPTVGEFLEETEKVWTADPRSVRAYGVCLRWFYSRAHGLEPRVRGRKHKVKCVKEWREAVNALPLASLTPKKVEAAILAHIAAAGSNPIAKGKAKRSTASLARQARSLFAPGLLRLLPFEGIQNPFQGVSIESARPMPYQSTIDAGQLLREARAELGETDPEVYKVILLCLGAGLRREEADNLCWTQVDEGRGVIRVEVSEHFDPKTRDSAGAVPVDPALIAELERYRAKATGLFVLEGGAPRPESRFTYYRAEETEERAIAWLRRHGLNTRKPLQALRKEAGSIVNAAADIHSASRFLRHSNIATTAAYYVDNRTGATVPMGTLLGTAPQQKAEVAK